MSTVFDTNLAAVRTALASFVGCAPSAFLTETLTVVDRPEPPVWPYVALAATFGTGTVLSVDRDYLAFAETVLPKKHYHATLPSFLGQIAEESRRRGTNPPVSVPQLGWTLVTVPDAPLVPAGLVLRVVDAEWMAEEMQQRRFENGVGLPGEGGREFRNKYGVALFDRDGAPAAVAGTFLTYADPIREIGVDVANAHRGRGLGRVVVAAAVREILERGEVPMYGCAPTNIRSQRTALSTGFLPAFSDAAVG
ncbi:MAG: GNAT family N-acetyltransferase [Dehalococcoidia bacterium]